MTYTIAWADPRNDHTADYLLNRVHIKQGDTPEDTAAKLAKHADTRPIWFVQRAGMPKGAEYAGGISGGLYRNPDDRIGDHDITCRFTNGIAQWSVWMERVIAALPPDVRRPTVWAWDVEDPCWPWQGGNSAPAGFSFHNSHPSWTDEPIYRDVYPVQVLGNVAANPAKHWVRQKDWTLAVAPHYQRAHSWAIWQAFGRHIAQWSPGTFFGNYETCVSGAVVPKSNATWLTYHATNECTLNCPTLYYVHTSYLEDFDLPSMEAGIAHNSILNVAECVASGLATMTWRLAPGESKKSGSTVYFTQDERTFRTQLAQDRTAGVRFVMTNGYDPADWHLIGSGMTP